MGSEEKLSLAHRAVIEPLLRTIGSLFSEYSFANLYLFREVHRYAVVLRPVPHILGTTYDGVRHAMPLAPLSEHDLRELLKGAACIYPVGEEIACTAAAFGLSSRWNDDDSDYIYDSAKLASLGGRVLRSKRAQAAAFATASAPTIAALGKDNISDALSVLELWDRQVPRPRSLTDYFACREAVENFEALGIHGILVYDSAGVPRGFLLAQSLGSGSGAVHFAKGDREQPGVYPYMFSRYAERSCETWLNFEQDLGNPGLRRAKRALDPVRMLRKYRLAAVE
jgi:uncharacterized protein